MKINIVSKDQRYIKVNELLLQRGYDSFICSLDTYTGCDCLILSVANELTDVELKELFAKTDSKTTVLSGNKQRIEKYFSGKIIDYGKEEAFLQKNALLTAEGTISYLHSLTKASLNNKKIFISGYGRIGKALCPILEALGAQIYVYARRKEVRKEIVSQGYISAELNCSTKCDIVINTVPAHIFSKELILNIPRDTFIVDLASYPYGFEDMERVNVASALPGKILPTSASHLVFDTIDNILSEAGKDNI